MAAQACIWGYVLSLVESAIAPGGQARWLMMVAIRLILIAAVITVPTILVLGLIDQILALLASIVSKIVDIAVGVFLVWLILAVLTASGRRR